MEEQTTEMRKTKDLTMLFLQTLLLVCNKNTQNIYLMENVLEQVWGFSKHLQEYGRRVVGFAGDFFMFLNFIWNLFKT